MNGQEAVTILDRILGDQELSSIQRTILEKSFLGISYKEIAEETKYNFNYIKDSGYRLWQLMSEVLGEKVSKKNIHSKLTKYASVLDDDTFSHQLRHSVVSSHYDVAEGNEHFNQTICEFPADKSDRHSTQKTINTDVENILRQRNQNVQHIPALKRFIGRQTELKTLERWILDGNCRIIEIVGMIGIGKTSLIAQFCTTHHEAFDTIIWLSLRHVYSFQETCKELLNHFQKDNKADNEEYTIEDFLGLFLNYISEYRCLIVLDDFDTIEYEKLNNREIDQSSKNYYKLIDLMGRTNHQSSLVLMSRKKMTKLSIMKGYSLDIKTLSLFGLNSCEIPDLFLPEISVNDHSYVSKLTELYDGNPLFLNLLRDTIVDSFDGNIELFMKERVLVFGDLLNVLEDQFLQFSKFERDILIWLTIFHHPINLSNLVYLNSVFSGPEYLLVLEELQQKRIIQIKLSSVHLVSSFHLFLSQMLIKRISQEFLNFVKKGIIPNDSYLSKYPISFSDISLTPLTQNRKDLKDDNFKDFKSNIINRLIPVFSHDYSLFTCLISKINEFKQENLLYERYPCTFLDNASLICGKIYDQIVEIYRPERILNTSNN